MRGWKAGVDAIGTLALMLCITVWSFAVERPPGLPIGPGMPSVLDLIKTELPPGYTPDDFACQNQDGVVHQWIMRGADRMDRVEISISPWNDRAQGYMQWKQGMIWTGTHELVPTSLGQTAMYYEAKDDCNKQLMMHHGPYFIEMHRPPREGVTHKTDPIERDSFVAIAEAVMARINEVANVPKSGWGGTLIRREVISASQTPAYGPAAGPKIEGGHFTVHTGEKAESFEVVGGNSAVGAIYHFNSTKRHVFTRAGNWAGLTGLELGPGRYVLSCNAMDKGIGAGGTGSLKIAFDVVSGVVQQPATGGGLPPLIDNDPNKPPPAFIMEPQISAQPVEIVSHSYLLPPPETKGVPSTGNLYSDFYRPGVVQIEQGKTMTIVVTDSRTGQVYNSIWGLGKGETIGYFTGNVFHAVTPGYCWVWHTSPATRREHLADGTIRETECSAVVTELFQVIPGPAQTLPAIPWSTSSEQILRGIVFHKGTASSNPVAGARVTLQSDVYGGPIDPAWSADDGSYGFTGRQLGLLPAGTYELHVYKRSEQVNGDLWNAQTETITLPITGVLERNIEVWRADKKFGIQVPVP